MIPFFVSICELADLDAFQTGGMVLADAMNLSAMKCLRPAEREEAPGDGGGLYTLANESTAGGAEDDSLWVGMHARANKHLYQAR